MKNLFAKLLLSIAVLAAVFSLSACGGNGENETTAGTTAAETTAVETATVPDSASETAVGTTETTTSAAETTTIPATQPPGETPDEQPVPLAVGQTAVVNSSATRFGTKSGGVWMAKFMPGYSFTVYQIDGDQVLIGIDGVYTGWVNKTDIKGAGDGTVTPPDPDTEPTEPPVTQPGTTSPATTAPATTKPATTTPPTTKPADTVNAPVGGSVTQIVNFYNKHANALKSFTGKVTVTKADGTVTVINSISGGNVVRNLAQDMLPNDYKAKPTLTFVNGVSGGTTLAKHLPRGDQAKMSVLEPAGVSSASCIKSGSGWKVTIALKRETVNSLSGVPKYTAQCMDTLGLTADDLKPFTLQSAQVDYINCAIEAVLDAQGRITKLDITTPAQITGKLKYGLIGINADVTGTYKGNYTFTY